MRQSAITLEPEMTPSEQALLRSTLQTFQLDGPHLEIGTAAGGTLKQMMQSYSGKIRPKFVVVDPMAYFPNQKEVVDKNLTDAGLDPSVVDFRRTTSLKAVHQAIAGGENFLFILIDAVHDAEHVAQDLMWTRLLDVGGIVAFHDYGKEKFPGVTWMVDRFLRRWPNYKVIGKTDSLILARKTEPSIRKEITIIDLIASAVCGVPLRWKRSIRKRSRLGFGLPKPS